MKTIVKLTFTILLIVGMIISTYSQDWTNYTMESTSNQLCGNRIGFIAVDQKNNKWFFTENGISKYDGNKWTTYNDLPENDICCFNVDNDGILWFGTWSGHILKFDGYKWELMKKLGSENVRCITVEYQNNKWFGGEGNMLLKYDNDQWEFDSTLLERGCNYLNVLCVFNITLDQKGCKWLASGYEDVGHVIKIDSAYHDYSFKDEVWSIATDNDDIVWAGTKNGSIYKYNPSLDKFDSLTNVSKIIYAILVDNNNIKWFETSNGLLKYNDTTWSNITFSDGLAGDKIYDIAKDLDGNLWVGTDKGVSVSKLTEGTSMVGSKKINKLKIYPNPAKNQIQIENFNTEGQNIIYSITEIQGKRIAQDKLNKQSIDITNLNSGFYIMKLVDGKHIWQDKFIVE